MAYQSRFIPKHPDKYLGDSTNIICRSSWERTFCRYCDNTSGVLKWGSEEFNIPYVKPTDGSVHRYFPDFFLEVRTNTGGVKQFVIEVKPKAQVNPPKMRRKSNKFLTELATYSVNQAKWAAAKAFCASRGWIFLVLTEEHLFDRANGR